MIYKEGGCLDELNDFIWVRIEYDGTKDESRVCIRDRCGGRLLAAKGCRGRFAKRFYDSLNVYFFGYE